MQFYHLARNWTIKIYGFCSHPNANWPQLAINGKILQIYDDISGLDVNYFTCKPSSLCTLQLNASRSVGAILQSVVHKPDAISLGPLSMRHACFPFSWRIYSQLETCIIAISKSNFVSACMELFNLRLVFVWTGFLSYIIIALQKNVINIFRKLYHQFSVEVKVLFIAFCNIRMLLKRNL